MPVARVTPVPPVRAKPGFAARGRELGRLERETESGLAPMHRNPVLTGMDIITMVLGKLLNQEIEIDHIQQVQMYLRPLICPHIPLLPQLPDSDPAVGLIPKVIGVEFRRENKI